MREIQNREGEQKWEKRRGMYAVFRLFVFYILKSQKDMNMHKAKHYTQVTVDLCYCCAQLHQTNLSFSN